jgi:hypothetical protein
VVIGVWKPKRNELKKTWMMTMLRMIDGGRLPPGGLRLELSPFYWFYWTEGRRKGKMDRKQVGIGIPHGRRVALK